MTVNIKFYFKLLLNVNAELTDINFLWNIDCVWSMIVLNLRYSCCRQVCVVQTEFTTCYLNGCFCSRYTLRLASKMFLVSRSNRNGCKLPRITGTCLSFRVATLWHLVSSFLWQHSPSLDPFHKETNLEQDVIFLFE